MAKYTVQMTFAAPALSARLRSHSQLPGTGMSLQMNGRAGHLAVVASGVSGESAAEAALAVLKAVDQRGPTAHGPITMVSWIACPDRVLAGFGRRGRGEGLTSWPPRSLNGRDDDGDAGGSAGVREPRRPLPGPGSLHAARELPGA